ncbi:protein of unknown function [Saccharicrinis carchari]|uniref:DUF4271 domain-containing protein n=1 Tax=Saccharicrinis carchari TaxID=1168039 RepID=A0A521EXA8_SACCC|nr:DUF4271 domain-containing protein [Saccharicrinis carchari]SMO87770.1 protein of unknown function [Saccharicrinis carchari]
MDRTGLSVLTKQLILRQDSVKTIPQSISIKVPTVKRLEVEAPKPVLTIPDIPERFKKPETPVKVVKKVFVPSAEDSLQFNLKKSDSQQPGILNNTLVRDYLSQHSVAGEQQDSSVIVPAEQIVGMGLDKPVSDTTATNASGLTKDTAYHVLQKDTMGFTSDSSATIESKSISTTRQADSLKHDGLSIESTEYSKDVLTGLLILSVAIAGFVRLTNFKYLQELFLSVFSLQRARNMLKTDSLRIRNASFSLSTLFLFNSALFIYEYIHFNKLSFAWGNGMLLIPVFMLLLFLFLFIKRILYGFVGFVFEQQEQTKEYMFYSSLTNKIFGLAVLPLILFVPYVGESAQTMLFNIGIATLALLYITQLLRGFSIILKNVSSLFYLFLYLCALEIIPFVIAYSIIVNMH